MALTHRIGQLKLLRDGQRRKSQAQRTLTFEELPEIASHLFGRNCRSQGRTTRRGSQGPAGAVR